MFFIKSVATHRKVLLVAHLVRQQHLDGLDVLLPNGVQERVADLDVVSQQQFDHLNVLVLNGDEQRAPAERVDAVDVDVEVDLRLLQTVAGRGDVSALHRQKEVLLLIVEFRLLADDAHPVAVAVFGHVDAQLIHELLRVHAGLLVLAVHLVHPAVDINKQQR